MNSAHNILLDYLVLCYFFNKMKKFTPSKLINLYSFGSKIFLQKYLQKQHLLR